MLPRRIPDYPDAYLGWNVVSSFGSLVSVVATVIFIYIIFSIFVNNNYSSQNPWAVISYFFSSKNENANSSYTIEWSLESPVPLHAYNTLPVQS